MTRCGALCRCWTSARRSSHHHADPWLEAAGCDSRPMMPPQRRGTSADLLAHVQHLHQQRQPCPFSAIPSLRSWRIASACDRHIEEWWRKRQHIRRSTKITFPQDGQRPGERRRDGGSPLSSRGVQVSRSSFLPEEVPLFRQPRRCGPCFPQHPMKTDVSPVTFTSSSTTLVAGV